MIVKPKKAMRKVGQSVTNVKSKDKSEQKMSNKIVVQNKTVLSYFYTRLVSIFSVFHALSIKLEGLLIFQAIKIRRQFSVVIKNYPLAKNYEYNKIKGGTLRQKFGCI
jgi:hypothetical protein